MNWASVAKSEPPKAAPVKSGGARPSFVVLDANALITQHGLLNLALAEKVVTTPEVLREVLVRFARATGDIHALSAADVRLIALAHGLEVAAHGSGHLRDLPEMPVVQKKKVHDHKELPGWGAEGGDWAEIDRLNEEEIAAAEATLLGGGGGGADLSEAVAAEGAEAGASRIATQVQQLTLEDARAATAAANGGDAASDSESEAEEEEEWETAAKSSSSKRKQHRRDARKAAWEARTQAAADAAAAGQGEAESAGGDAASGDVADAAAVEEAEEAEQEGGQEEEEDTCSLASDDDATATHTTAAYAGDGKGQQPVAAEGQHAAEEQQQQGGSSVCIITADFAMQNVIMQMGLNLVTPDGRRITRLSRWVLRCTACFCVTKEMGRLFCPRCGNSSLDKVQLVVGPDGSEQYGVRRKHILRGTRFPLPKPKGGRYNDLILREDQLLAKAHRLRAKKKDKEELDPFAPEYGEDTWHQAAGMHYGAKGAAALLAGWKNNPNERKHIATNRRRK
ncbi:RNA-binding protein NOB1 [Chlorella vulgaris]